MRRSLETECLGWRAPECPFPIEWSAAMMEEIRGAAMEAFFSVPHGGAEIGGVLWGNRAGGRVRIMSARPLECEHALGPTFTLSDNDHTRLAALLQDGLEDGCRDLRAQGWEPVGWYHSHTRSEIFLSERDVEIHNRYFPDPWHVALVVRPHAMQPMRAGFFFREPNGSIHTDSSYKEFLLQPVPEAVAGKSDPQGAVEQPVAPAIASPPLAAAPPPLKRARRRIWWAMLAVGIAAGLFAFKNETFSEYWARAFGGGRVRYVSLTAYDLDGQLQIRWDWSAEPIRSAESGTLEIADGATRTVVALDQQRLRSGTVSYARIGARVDVRLALRQHGGDVCTAFTYFLGHAGETDTPTATLRREFQDEATHIRQVERDVADLRGIVQRGQK